jgi:hypothetical protein
VLLDVELVNERYSQVLGTFCVGDLCTRDVARI